MAWLQGRQGVFKLHDSDAWCGSLVSVADTAEILAVSESALQGLPTEIIDGVPHVDELDVHRVWGADGIHGALPQRLGSTRISLDERILARLIELTLPGAVVETQVPWGRERIDLRATWRGQTRFIEFMGPSHFIVTPGIGDEDPAARKRDIEDAFGVECVLWPYWIQRAASNVRALFEDGVRGLASVWSTRAYFGDFTVPDAENLILSISGRFSAVRSEGLGYMYGHSHVAHTPDHPILGCVRSGRADVAKLVPPGATRSAAFWIPGELLR